MSRVPGTRQFIQKISAKCGYVDPVLVEKIYLAMLRVILDDLRDKDDCYLPQFGRFVTIVHKGSLRQPVYDDAVGSGLSGYTERKPTRLIKFRANYLLKHYIANKLKKGELGIESP